MNQIKLIISQYKLIVQAFKHHNLEKSFVQGILMYHFEKKTLKNLEIFERKKWAFLKKLLGSPMPIVMLACGHSDLSSFNKFLLKEKV